MIRNSLFLISAAFVVVVGLIVLIAVFKLNPFITLFLKLRWLWPLLRECRFPRSSIFRSGVGATLGHIAIVWWRSERCWKDVAESGGADRIAHTLIRFLERREFMGPWMVIGS